MPSCKLRKGIHFLYRGSEYVIDQRLPNQDIRIKDIANNECMSIKEETIIDALFSGNLELLNSDSGANRELRDSRLIIEELSLLDVDPKKRMIKEIAKRRYKYVQEVLARKLTKFTEGSLNSSFTNWGEQNAQVFAYNQYLSLAP